MKQILAGGTGQGDPLADHFQDLRVKADQYYDAMMRELQKYRSLLYVSPPQQEALDGKEDALVLAIEAYAWSLSEHNIELTIAAGLGRYFQHMGWELPPDGGNTTDG